MSDREWLQVPLWWFVSQYEVNGMDQPTRNKGIYDQSVVQE